MSCITALSSFLPLYDIALFIAGNNKSIRQRMRWLFDRGINSDFSNSDGRFLLTLTRRRLALSSLKTGSYPTVMHPLNYVRIFGGLLFGVKSLATPRLLKINQRN
jgi:hypothetical protein